MLRLSVSLLLLAAPALAETLVVLNKSDHEAVMVDPTTYASVGRVSTGLGPHEAATSPDGRYAYVANYGSFAVFRDGEKPKMQPGNSITVLDLKERKVKAHYPLGQYSQPHGIWVSKDGKLVWVTAEGAQAVLEVDASTGKILRAWQTGQNVSHMVAPTPDEKKLYIANIGSGSVTVIDRVSGKVTSIPTAAGAEGIDVAPNGGEVWVSNRGAHNISILDAAADQVVATIPSGGQVPIRLKFTPDGKHVLVCNAQSNLVTIFDAAARKQVGEVAVGAVPVGILITPDGRRAFVANTNGNQVTVIDLGARQVVKTFTTGNEPDGMAWAK
ncbi:MAG: beta-propeller fold lactonase family protein [Acidobacteria bacterium]|nr:beta-propeller fold lactonase family protein [Acidobacteriota bacterium]